MVFTITEKAPSRAFSWLKVPTSAFTFKTLLRHYAFNQEKALVGAISVIVQLRRLIVCSTSSYPYFITDSKCLHQQRAVTFTSSVC